MIRFILDSGDPQEFREITQLAKEKGTELWGATTNPSLIAKKAVEELQGKKITKEEAFSLQKELTLEILEIVPGAVSAEVYADEKTTATEMIEQGMQIATRHERVVVKLPTTIEGFKARTELRKQNIIINNTLGFHNNKFLQTESVLESALPAGRQAWPCFISPFVGRLDDIGENGMNLVRNGMKIKQTIQT